jgi:tRNA threonylcarbamoyladenosine modification (KEOPS) complex Cgi121 subunit
VLITETTEFRRLQISRDHETNWAPSSKTENLVLQGSREIKESIVILGAKTGKVFFCEIHERDQINIVLHTNNRKIFFYGILILDG